MAIRNVLIATILCFLTPYFAYTQSNYTVLNDATAIAGCHCYQLTPDQGNQGGGVYQNNTINLNNSFDYTFSVFLGCNGSSGADGMCFILTNNITAIGAQGGGLGYSGLSGNSLAVEYDTYQNGWDPDNHHIAIEYGGQVQHPTGTLSGPVDAIVGGALMDDCAWHTTEVVWNATAQTYTVYFDGVLRLTYTGNIIANYFANNPVVNWGWSGSTGGAENTQQVCFNSTANYTAGTNYQTCDPTVQFTDISTAAVATIQGWAWNFGDPGSGANNTSTLENPTHTFSTTGTFSVSLIITDISGCKDTAIHTVTVAPNITLTPTLTDPLCNGGNNGDISLATTGGFGTSAGYGGYQYTWSNSATGSSNVGLTAGTYNVTCTDGVCSATASYTLTQPTALTATTSSTAAPCGGTGTATITISGGTPPYQNVTWDGIAGTPGPNTYTTSGLPVGTVVANFKDANGCSALLEYTQNIIQLPCGYTESTSSTNVTCFGESNGSVTLNVTGQVGTVTVVWDNSSGTQVGTGYTVTNLPAGTYTYHYSDTKPTTLTGTVTVTQPGGALTVSLATVNTTCSYLNNGSAVASVTANGTSPYSYAWSAAGQSNSPTATGLSPGAITVTVTDANGCTGTATGTVSGQTPIGLVISTTPDSCFQTLTGTISVVASGGTPNYTYQWSSGPTAVGSTVYSLGSGSYTVTVTDHNSCTATASGTINQPPQLTVTMTDNNIACFGGATGTATVNPAGGNGGYTYSWSPTPATTAGITGLTPNTYYVTVTDSKLCTVVDSAVITQPASAFTVSTAQTNVKCFGASTGSITLTPSGGTTPYGAVTWTGGLTGLNPTNVAAGSYTYTIADANGCSATGTVTITQPASAFTVSTAQTNVKCFGASTGSITLTPSGGTTPYGAVTWTGGLTGLNPTNVAAGSYTYTIADANGCSATGTVTITQPASAFSVSTAQTNVKCFGASTGSITLTPSGGTTPYGAVTWTGGLTGLNPTNVPAGSYTYTIADANGCSATGTVTITQPASAFTVSTAQTNVKCFGASTGSITLTPSGGTTPYGAVTWTGGLTGLNPTNVPAGSYTYTIADANGCSATGTVTITQPASAFTVSTAQTNVKCFGASTGSITLTPSGGTTPYGAVTWTGGLTGLNPTNVPAGSYTYTIADANGCSATGTVTITQPASAFTVSTAQTNITCYNTATGSITLTPSGGTTPYGAVTWTGGLTGLNPTNVPAGSYTYTIADANGCSATGTVTITQPASAFTVSTAQTNVKCFGASTGSITLTPSGGTTPYGAVTWTGGLTGLNPTNVPAGSYTYTIADANGCSATGTVTITQPASAFTVSTAQTNVKCFGASTGSITLTPSGGTTPYGAVTWTGGLTGLNPTNVPAGSYTYTIADANGCSATGTVTITQPASAFTVSTAQTNVKCFGASTGSITLTPSGGTTPYGAVTWTGGLTGLNPTNVPAGSYTYTIADANGCSATGTVTITQPASAFTVSTAQTNVKCFGASTGSITLTPSGGTTPYGAVTWTGGLTGLNPTNVPAGSYTYTIADANGCSATGTVTITQPASAFTVSTAQTNITCYNTATGSITLTPSGGTTPYGAVTWTGGLTGLNPTNVPAGSYTYTIADANGCSATGTVTITQPATGLTVTYTQTNVLCFGGSTGSITLTPSGGATPYGPVTWTGGLTGLNPTNVAAGSYTYTISDANGCPATGTVVITQPAAAFTVGVAQTNVSCFGGSDGTITLTPSGGTTPYGAVTWTGGLTGLNPTNVAVGSYTYTISDANGCTATGTVNITQPASAFAVTYTQVNVLCFGGNTGSISLTPSGGTTPYGAVTWTGGLTGLNPTNVAAGSYTYTIADANGCSQTGTVTITQPASAFTVSNTQTNVSCFGGSDGTITLTPSGGTTPYGAVTWTGGLTGLNPTNVAVGSYTYTISDANGCPATGTVVITQPAAAFTVGVAQTNVSCFGGSDGTITLTPSGGTTPYGAVTWTGGLNGLNPTNVAAGSYTYTIADANGCSATGTVTITQPASAFAVTYTQVNVLCFGGNTGSISLTPSGGTTPYGAVTWTGGLTGLNPTNVAAGSYTYTIADANGCSQTGTVTITQPASAFTVSNTQTNVSCFGGSDGTITLTPSGGTTPYGAVTWTGGLTGLNPTNVAAGSYTYTISDANGCPATGTVTITQPAQISAVNNPVPVSCFGGNNGSITVTPDGGTQPFTSSWSNGSTSADPTGLTAGTYTDTLTDANGCQYIDAGIVVTQPAQITIAVDSVTLVSCPGDSNGAVQITASNGTPGYTYSWSPGGGTSDPLTGVPVGSYSVTVTDANHCTATDSATVGVNNPLSFNSSVNNVLCPPQQNGSISLTVSGGAPGYQYIWSNGATTSSITNLNVGIDSVTVTDSRGCSFDTGFVIINDSAFAISLQDTLSINQGDEELIGVNVTKDNGAGNASFSWTPPTGLSCSDCQSTEVAPFVTTQYTVTATTDMGCIATAQILVTVNPQHQLYVPNAFTPNGDGVNDYWEAFGSKTAWTFCSVSVFDRWGEKVFESQDINFQWDGKYKGTYVEPGEFVYMLKVVFVDGYAVENKGTITVIR